jgi:predicted PurR-regulated permease PerM
MRLRLPWSKPDAPAADRGDNGRAHGASPDAAPGEGATAPEPTGGPATAQPAGRAASGEPQAQQQGPVGPRPHADPPEQPQTPPPIPGERQPGDEVHPQTSVPDPAADARPVPPVVVPRWIQLVLLPVALVGLWALARAAGTVLLVLLIASVIALILNPLVKMLERGRIPRGLAILIVYLGGFAILGGLGVLLSDPISTQVSRFSRDVPHFIDKANHDLADVQTWLNGHGIKVQIQQQGQTALQTLEKHVLKSSGSIVSFSRDLLSQVVTISFDLVLVLVLSIYLLVYGRQIGDLVRRIMPPGDGTPEDDFPLLVQRAVFGYVRGQVLFSLIMGASAALALWLFGVIGIFPDGKHYALFFAGFYGLMEFIPYIGPIIGPLPAVLVALFNDPISAVWVILLFVGLQQLEGHIVAPQVFRISLRINPILIILSLLIGYQLYGIAGALVALPLASIVRQTVLYLRRHLVLEPWVVAAPGAAAVSGGGILGPGPEPSHDGPDRCPDCGTAPEADDAFCRRCGASLEPRVRTSR